MYHLFFRLFLRHVPAERAHALAKSSLRLVRATPPGRALVRRLIGPTPSCVATEAFGLTFPSPLGVGAGLDKDATWFEDLGALGFGFVEVGTITALPQPGNPRPRVARFISERALLNSIEDLMTLPWPCAQQSPQGRLELRRILVGIPEGQ